MPANEPKDRIALVVDDDDKAADVLRLFLEAEGFSVVRALSAEDAILIVPQQTLTLITLDLQLYGMNGWQLLQKLHESGDLTDVPVIVVSGRTVDDVAKSRGVAAVLQKPISRVQLKATLSRLGLIHIASGFGR
jgi:CheY-like chemotaxis protein